MVVYNESNLLTLDHYLGKGKNYKKREQTKLFQSWLSFCACMYVCMHVCDGWALCDCVCLCAFVSKWVKLTPTPPHHGLRGFEKD